MEGKLSLFPCWWVKSVPPVTPRGGGGGGGGEGNLYAISGKRMRISSG